MSGPIPILHPLSSVSVRWTISTDASAYALVSIAAVSTAAAFTVVATTVVYAPEWR